MSVLPVPSFAVDGHRPWPPELIATLSHRALLARAGELLGLPTARLPLPLRWGPGADQLAVLRAAAELMLARLEQSTGACPDCDGSERRLDCARELGTLEARLAALANDAKLVLGWLQETSEEERTAGL